MNSLIHTTFVFTLISAISVVANGQSTQKPKTDSKDLLTVLGCGCCEGSVTSPLIHALDIDKDGVITELEIKNAKSSLMALDANGDGKLSQNEFHAEKKAKSKAKKPAPGFSNYQSGKNRQYYVDTIYAKFDTNGNEVIEKSEMSGPLLAMLPAIDRNKDNRLTYDELMVISESVRNYQGPVNETENAQRRRGKNQAKRRSR